ncbi:MAG TPA: hypothetical protein VK198_05840 [Terriglobales bacterium]|jgi:hypothetical protein|nr:hypothetical protein [Terriglobales bacterium]
MTAPDPVSGLATGTYVCEFEPDPDRVRQPQWMAEVISNYFS